MASRIFRVNSHLDEADDYLCRAYDRVMLVAENIKDDDLRQSYLQKVPEHRRILKEAKERGIAAE